MRKRPGFGSLLIIGGHEDKTGDKIILRFLAKKIGKSAKVVVATIASEMPGEMFDEYEQVFRGLGIRHVHHLGVESREEAGEETKVRILKDADAVFFTGGDQLRITSQLGDTPIFARIHEIFSSGGLIAGTSAGASVMTETMLVSGDASESQRIDSTLKLAPGFGLLPGVIVDQHFAERGRISRLLSAVAQNPRIIGIGVDEDSAIFVQRGRFQVVGTNAVYVIDGSKITFTNITESDPDNPVGVYGIRLHVMNQADRFDLKSRRPRYTPEKEILEQLGLSEEKKPGRAAS